MFHLFVRSTFSPKAMIPSADINKYTIRQCLLGTAIVIDLFLGGAGYTYSATLLPKLDHFNVSESDQVWIATLPSLACMPGAILGPFFLEFLGRKWSYVIIAMWNLINWTILSFSSATWHILLARTMQGLNEGMSYSLSTCFIVEVAPLQYRAKLLNTINVGVALGMLFVDIVGSFNSWRTSALILACLSLIDAIILLFMKNTHVWYLQRGRIDDAKMAYFWYRPQTNKNTQILNQEIEIYRQKANISLNELSKEWLKREFLFPLLIMIWFTATMMTSGGYAIALYSVDVMSNVIALDGYTITIIIDVVRVAASITTIFLLEVSPIRWMINAGTFVCSITLLIRAASLYWEDVWSGMPIVTLAMIFIYTVFYNLGYVNMWSICLGELFTGITKTSGTALVASCFFGIQFGLGQVVPIMFENLGDATYVVFAVCTFIGGCGLGYFMPETKGVSSEQIRANFRKKKLVINKLEKHTGTGAF